MGFDDRLRLRFTGILDTVAACNLAIRQELQDAESHERERESECLVRESCIWSFLVAKRLAAFQNMYSVKSMVVIRHVMT